MGSSQPGSWGRGQGRRERKEEAACLTYGDVLLLLLLLGHHHPSGLGCGANPDVGKVAGEESKAELLERVGDSHMVFITAGMGGGTGTGAAPVIAQTCLEVSQRER